MAHLLSDTVEGPGKPGRDRLFIELSHRVQSAERTVALDADMSWITFDTLLRMQTRLTRASNKAVLPSVHVWINQQKIRAGQPSILLFKSQQHLVSELDVAVDEGQKCFVTSNSKTLVERLAAALAHQFGSGRRVLLITSSTVSSEEVQGFISDPATRIRD